MTTSASMVVGQFVVDGRQAPLEGNVIAKGLICLLEAIAGALEALEEPTARRIRDTLVSGGDEAVVWGTTHAANAATAAQINGTAAHAHCHDDTDMAAWSHPGSLIVPACVAVAEREDSSLEQLVRAVVTGYAVLHWLGGDGHVSRQAVHRGLRASAHLGCVAAAAGTASLLSLNARGVADAVTIAADLAGGNVDPVRSGHASWRLQNGWAGHLGVMAADLATAGQTANPLGLTQGWLHVATGSTSQPTRWERPPSMQDVLEVWHKHSATLGDNIAATACALQLHEVVGDPRTLEHVNVTIARDFAEYPGTAFRGPFERVDQALASTAFAVAMCLVRGTLKYEEQAQSLTDSSILAVLDRVVVRGSEDFGYLDAEVEVVAAHGIYRVHSGELPRSTFYPTLEQVVHRLVRACLGADLGNPSAALGRVAHWAAGTNADPGTRTLTAALRP